MREFTDGSAAIVRGALDAGCTFFAGYPITPASLILMQMMRGAGFRMAHRAGPNGRYHRDNLSSTVEQGPQPALGVPFASRVARHGRLTYRALVHGKGQTPPFMIVFINSICNLTCEHCF